MKTFLLDLAPLVAIGFITVCYIPQIIKTIKTKDVKGQSLAFWIMLDIALLGNVLQQVGLIQFMGNTRYLGLIEQSINLSLAILQTGLIIKYKEVD